MGLILTKTISTGETKTGYLRVNQIRGQKIIDSAGNISFKIFAHLDFWASKDIYDNAYLTLFSPLERNYVVSFNGVISDDLYKQSYIYLKSLPDGINEGNWSSAIDA